MEVARSWPNAVTRTDRCEQDAEERSSRQHLHNLHIHLCGPVVLRPLEDQDLRTVQRGAVERGQHESLARLAVDGGHDVEARELGPRQADLQADAAPRRPDRPPASAIGGPGRRPDVPLPPVPSA
jgi:hypothetical protein